MFPQTGDTFAKTNKQTKNPTQTKTKQQQQQQQQTPH